MSKKGIMKEDFKSVLKEKRIFRPSKSFSRDASIKSFSEYKRIYNDSVKNPEKLRMAEYLIQ